MPRLGCLEVRPTILRIVTVNVWRPQSCSDCTVICGNATSAARPLGELGQLPKNVVNTTIAYLDAVCTAVLLRLSMSMRGKTIMLKDGPSRENSTELEVIDRENPGSCYQSLELLRTIYFSC